MIGEFLNTVNEVLGAVWSVFIICCVIGILFGLHMKNQKEKREALNMTIILSVVYIIISAFFEMAGQIAGSTTIGQRTTPMDILGFLVVVYLIIYSYLSNAKRNGKAAYQIKLYSNLEELENWLNEIGKEGYVCTESAPEWYLFKLKQEENAQYYYKTEYVSNKAKDTAAYIAENEKKGWHLAQNSAASQYKTYKATLLVFYTTDGALEAGPVNRHQPSNLESRVSATIVSNLILIGILIIINVFVLPNEPAMQFMTALILCVSALQIAIRLNFALNKKSMM